MKSHKCKYNNILLLYLYTTNKKNKLISTNNSFLCGKQCCITVFCVYLHMHIIKWRDIRPSMVTHTRNMCSAIIPSKVHTHSSGHTHTPWTHTRSSGQPFMLRHPGSSWGFSVLLKGTSVVVLKVERALHAVHSPHLQFLPDRDSNLQPLVYRTWTDTIQTYTNRITWCMQV